MFLDLIKQKNPALIEAAAGLHSIGSLPANTYVIDLDTVMENASAVVKASEESGVSVYFMSKHFNRNPIVCRALVNAGFPGAVAVDVQCAKALARYGIPVKHVGHLVQIPRSEVPHILRIRPEVWTVYSVENARIISDEAVSMGMIQDILLRVRSENDIIYPNEEGGIWEQDLKQAAEQIRELQGVRIVGTVTFPGTLVSEPQGGRATINAKTAVESAQRLSEWGFEIKQINLPGASSSKMLPIVKKAGGTHAEPGHGLFGTTPWHLIEDLPERPAMVYLNEISHTFENKAYCFGGGFYACDTPANRGDDSIYRLKRSWNPHAYVGNGKEDIFDRCLRADTGSFFGRTLNATDYNGALFLEGEEVHSGMSAIFGFRAQAFTMRSNVAVLRDVGTNPRVVGVFDRANNLLDENWYPYDNSVQRVNDICKKEFGM